MFSNACNHSFSISLDNLAMKGHGFDSYNFRQAVTQQIVDWCSSDNMPPRGLQFLNALSLYFHTNPKSVDLYLFEGL
jgi:elongation factor P hydroxylase